MWYFAYGSNLCTFQMTARIGVNFEGADRPRRAHLPSYRLAFNAGNGNGRVFANIVQPGERVLGVVYALRSEDFEKLDAFEKGYERKTFEVSDDNGAKFDAFAYVARPNFTTADASPASDYLERILLGARSHGLPEEYLRSIEFAAGIAGENE